MSDKKYIIAVIESSEVNEREIEKYLEKISDNTVKIRSLYKVSDEKVVSALEKILELTKYASLEQ